MSEALYEIPRRKSRAVMVGKVQVGGDAPVSIQSMTSTHTYDVQETIDQIKRLEDAGCEIIRVTVESQQSLRVLDKIKAAMTVPLVADIHFAYQMALGSIDAGADKIRINPGNIGGEERFKEIAEAYATLKSPEKREEYDRLGRHPAGQNFTPPPEPSKPSAFW